MLAYMPLASMVDSVRLVRGGRLRAVGDEAEGAVETQVRSATM